MKKGTVKKITAMLMAGAMMAGMSAMPVFADDGVVTIKKTITKETNVYLPEATFAFTNKGGEAGSYTDSKGKTFVVAAGPDGGITISDDEIKCSPSTRDIGETSVELTDTASVTVNESAFTGKNAGIYRYKIQEASSGVEGMVDSTAVKYFDVYWGDNDGDGTKEVYFKTFVDPKKNEKDSTPFNNNYSTSGKNGVNDLTVKKVVTGNQVSGGEEFSFTVTVAGNGGKDWFYISTPDGSKTIDSKNTSATFNLANNETAIIYGLSKSDTYTITENNAADYTTKIEVGGVETDGKTLKGKTISADTTVTVTNTKNAATPTGIVMDIAPYVIMVAAAVVLAFTFLRKRSYTK